MFCRLPEGMTQGSFCESKHNEFVMSQHSESSGFPFSVVNRCAVIHFYFLQKENSVFLKRNITTDPKMGKMLWYFSLCAGCIAHRTKVLESKAIIIIGDCQYVTEAANPIRFSATVSVEHRQT